MQSPRIVFLKALDQHLNTLPINALVFSPDGTLLFSGGDDEKVRVWEVQTFECVQVLESEKWGQITTITYAQQEQLGREIGVLLVGTGRGNVSLIPCELRDNKRFDVKKMVISSIFEFNDPVQYQAYDKINSRLVFSSFNGDLKMFTLEKLSMVLLWETKYDHIHPGGVFFFGGANQSLLTFGLETSEMHCREAGKDNILWKKTLTGGIGSTALSSDQTTLVVHNLSNGTYDIYMVPDNAPVHTLPITLTRSYIKQCHFLDTSKFAVCGSDSNKVYVVDVAMNQKVDVLTSGKADMTQTIGVTPISSPRTLIAAACGGSISIWEKLDADLAEEDEIEEERPTRNIPPHGNGVNGQVILLVLVLTYANWSPMFFKFMSNLIAKFDELKILVEAAIRG